jgi:hypothetical protein
MNLILISSSLAAWPPRPVYTRHALFCTTLITYSADNIHYVNLAWDTV